MTLWTNKFTAGQLRHMDGKKVRFTCDQGEGEGIIVTVGEAVYIHHNIDSIHGATYKEVPGYDYGFNLRLYGKPDEYITTEVFSLELI